MTLELSLAVVSSIISIASIFISNYLGTRSSIKQRNININEKRYDNLYLPLLKLLYEYIPIGLKYQNLLNDYNNDNKAKELNPFTKIIYINMKYASPELIQLSSIFSHYYIQETESKNNLDPKKLKQLNYNTQSSFFKLIHQLIHESKNISKDIGMPDLTQSLIKMLHRAKSKEQIK